LLQIPTCVSLVGEAFAEQRLSDGQITGHAAVLRR